MGCDTWDVTVVCPLADSCVEASVREAADQNLKVRIAHAHLEFEHDRRTTVIQLLRRVCHKTDGKSHNTAGDILLTI